MGCLARNFCRHAGFLGILVFAAGAARADDCTPPESAACAAIRESGKAHARVDERIAAGGKVVTDPAAPTTATTAFSPAAAVADRGTRAAADVRNTATEESTRAAERGNRFAQEGTAYALQNLGKLPPGDAYAWNNLARNQTGASASNIRDPKLNSYGLALETARADQQRFEQVSRDYASISGSSDGLAKATRQRENRMATIDRPSAIVVRPTGAREETARTPVPTPSSAPSAASSRLPSFEQFSSLGLRDAPRGRQSAGSPPEKTPAIRNVPATGAAVPSAEAKPGSRNPDVAALAATLGKLPTDPAAEAKEKRLDDMLMLAVKMTPGSFPTGRVDAEQSDSALAQRRLASATSSSGGSDTIFQRVSRRIRFQATFLGMER